MTGVMRLPSGRLVRGRALWKPVAAEHEPEFSVFLLGRKPPPVPWGSRWVRWPDWWLPLNPDDAKEAVGEAWDRARTERVEFVCAGGRGRTGTALACLAVIDGVAAVDAVDFVRAQYRSRAVETPWQRRYVSRFSAGAVGDQGDS